MNKFRTVLQPEVSSFQIEHQSGVLCMGSCFAEHIAKRLKSYKFRTFLNPFGIVYNPMSITRGFDFLLENEKIFDENDLFQHLDGWHSFQHHGSFSHPEKEVALNQINSRLNEARLFFKNAQYLILTLGTANVFVHKKSGEVVTNCHKVPQQEFIKKELSVEEMVILMSDVLQKINNAFPNLKIITTVSPVRHIRDGLVENQVSKSKLLLTLHQVSKQYAHVSYFPSYEIMMDDLRDYRFYKKDMIHPNELAVDYIWGFFSKTFFPEKTIALNARVEKINMAVAHRPFHPQSAAHLEFKKKQLEKVEQLGKEFPFLNFEEERGYFSS